MIEPQTGVDPPTGPAAELHPTLLDLAEASARIGQLVAQSGAVEHQQPAVLRSAMASHVAGLLGDVLTEPDRRRAEERIRKAIAAVTVYREWHYPAHERTGDC